MKKLSKILTAILCVIALTSAFAFTACGGNNDGTQTDNGDTQTENGDTQTEGGGTQTESGGNTQTGDNGNQGDNTQTDDKEPEHVPVTTVANAEEWKKAFDIIRLKSFTMVSSYKEISNKTEISTISQIDLENCKSYTEKEDSGKGESKVYQEYVNDILWLWQLAGGTGSVEKSGGYADTDAVKTKIINNGSAISGIAENTIYLADRYADFEFDQAENCYVFRIDFDNQSYNVSKIKIIDGIVAEYKMVDSSYGGIEYVWEFKNVNSTTVTAPEGAREAIDAEIAKG